MAHFTEHHKTKWSLFKRIHEVFEQNGLYAAEKEKGGYTLNYWLDVDKVYRVVKGPDEEDEEEIEGDFIFNHLPYESDVEEISGYADELTLDAGDILVFVTEIDDTVWFTCTTMPMDGQEMNSDWAIGFTEYGTL
ncbi:hypothetical protein, partial [Niastella koreensis]